MAKRNKKRNRRAKPSKNAGTQSHSAVSGKITTPSKTDKTQAINWPQLIGIFIIAKILVIGFLLASFYTFDDAHQINLWNRWYTDDKILDAWYLPFANWDAQYYLLLADQGYAESERPEAAAFFPLYPILIGTLHQVIDDIHIAAFLLNIVLSFGFIYWFYRYAAHYLPGNNALFATVLLLTYPSAFYLTVFYAEALFLMLLFGFLYYYHIKKNYWSLGFIALLPIVRPQTAFIFAALVFILFIRHFNKDKIDYRYEFFNLLAGGAGILCYLLFYHITMGSPFAGIEAQKYFISGNAISNIINPFHFLNYLKSETEGVFAHKNGLMDKLFIIISLIMSITIIRSKQWLWLAFYLALVYPPASMGYGMSFVRYSLSSIPFFLLAWLQYANRNRVLIYAIGVLFATLQIYFIFRFSLNMWVA